jgi:hypothetical protein
VKNAIIKHVIDTVEHTLFGATAEERVAAHIALIDQRVERALGRMVDGLAEGRMTRSSPAIPR